MEVHTLSEPRPGISSFFEELHDIPAPADGTRSLPGTPHSLRRRVDGAPKATHITLDVLYSNGRVSTLLSTKARVQGGSLTTSIPAEVARRLGVSAGTDLFWVEDGQGGYRVYPGGDKGRRILEAHEEAISDYRDVFRELAR